MFRLNLRAASLIVALALAGAAHAQDKPATKPADAKPAGETKPGPNRPTNQDTDSPSVFNRERRGEQDRQQPARARNDEARERGLGNMAAVRGAMMFEDFPVRQLSAQDAKRQLVKFWENERVAEQLKLTPEQKTRLNNLHETAQKTIDALEPQIRDANTAVREALRKQPQADIAAANAGIDTSSKLYAESLKTLVGYRNDVRNTLTEEQRQAIRDLGRGRGGDRNEGGSRGPGSGNAGQQGDSGTKPTTDIPTAEQTQESIGKVRETREKLATAKTKEEAQKIVTESGLRQQQQDALMRNWERENSEAAGRGRGRGPIIPTKPGDPPPGNEGKDGKNGKEGKDGKNPKKGS